MREKPFTAWLMLAVLLTLPGLAVSQAGKPVRGGVKKQTLIVNGQPEQVAVIQLNGRSYVDLEALARVANGSLSFSGNQITLTLAGSDASTPTTVPPTTVPPTNQPANPGFSKDFLRAGIEEMAMIREWRSGLLSAVQNGYPVTEDWMAGYRGQAATNLSLASVAVSTDYDRSAFQLLSTDFDNMKKLSDKFLETRKSREYLPPDALNNDPLFHKILSCARSLGSMAASGQFEDDGSCH